MTKNVPPPAQQRRWREVPKDELDAEISKRGKPIPMTKEQREASAMRKQNKAIEGRKAAAKKKS